MPSIEARIERLEQIFSPEGCTCADIQPIVVVPAKNRSDVPAPVDPCCAVHGMQKQTVIFAEPEDEEI